MARINPLLMVAIVQVCERNGNHWFTWNQVKHEIESYALQPGSGIENPDSAIMTASFDLSGEASKANPNGNFHNISHGHGEYEWRDPDWCEAWKEAFRELKKRNSSRP